RTTPFRTNCSCFLHRLGLSSGSPLPPELLLFSTGGATATPGHFPLPDLRRRLANQERTRAFAFVIRDFNRFGWQCFQSRNRGEPAAKDFEHFFQPSEAIPQGRGVDPESFKLIDLLPSSVLRGGGAAAAGVPAHDQRSRSSSCRNARSRRLTSVTIV
ncbi:hypothetical protein EJB05_39388, partial [Eragrostis curvula]